MGFSAFVSFMNLFLKEKSIDYEIENDCTLSFKYRGFNIVFSEDTQIYYIITIPNLYKVEDDKRGKIFEIINEYNIKYPFVQFYINDDNKVSSKIEFMATSYFGNDTTYNTLVNILVDKSDMFRERVKEI